jgi:hypothetical protein
MTLLKYWLITGCVALNGSALADPPVGGDEVWMGIDIVDSAVINHEWEHTNYKCVETPQCAKHTPVSNPQGNIKGCTPVTGPPASCTGTCNICEGGSGSGNLCRRTNVATDKCSGSVGSIDCGNRASSTCLLGGAMPGLNGCGCTTPATYPTGSSCEFAMCQL